MSRRYLTFLSIIFGLMLSGFSVCLVFSGIFDSGEMSLTNKLLVWNMYVAIYLMDYGLLPSCSNCEMTGLVYMIFNGFIIGQIVYSTSFFSIGLLVNKPTNVSLRNDPF